MSRLWRLGFVAILLASLMHVANLALPGRTFACSCRASGPEEIGRFADDPQMVVFVGTVVSMSGRSDVSGHTTGELQVALVFKGQVPAARVPVVGGGGGDCTMALTAGQRMITAARIEGGVITPGLCGPYGDPGTAEGQALIQEAIKAYGPGVAPPGATDPQPAQVADDPWLPVVLSVVILASVALFLAVAIVARRSRMTG